MTGRTAAHRRLLFIAYRRYLAADRALEIARSAALEWLPDATASHTALLGDPGSRIRRLYDRRNRALARLDLARRGLVAEKRRARERDPRTTLLIATRRG